MGDLFKMLQVPVLRHRNGLKTISGDFYHYEPRLCWQNRASSEPQDPV